MLLVPNEMKRLNFSKYKKKKQEKWSLPKIYDFSTLTPKSDHSIISPYNINAM